MQLQQKQALKLWRDRMAWRARRYHKVLGRWPDKEVFVQIKRALEVASLRGLKPPYIH